MSQYNGAGSRRFACASPQRLQVRVGAGLQPPHVCQCGALPPPPGTDGWRAPSHAPLRSVPYRSVPFPRVPSVPFRLALSSSQGVCFCAWAVKTPAPVHSGLRADTLPLTGAGRAGRKRYRDRPAPAVLWRNIRSPGRRDG